MAEVLTEAHLYEAGVTPALIREIMRRRDELLRYFARSMKRTAYMVAQALEDAATDQNKLEVELVEAFDSMGFSAVRIGGKGKPDGSAEASLAAVSDGIGGRYSVSLEAKSKEDAGKKVSAKAVSVSTVALHRDESGCDHALVAGPDFPTEQDSSLVKQVRANQEQTGRTITVVRLVDLARLCDWFRSKGWDLQRLREFFRSRVSTQEAKAWIDRLQNESPAQPAYGDILDTIWSLQKEVPAETVEFSAVATALRKDRGISQSKNEIAEYCRALSRMTPHIVVRDQSVELTQRPDRIMEAAGSALRLFPKPSKRKPSSRLTKRLD